MFRYTGKLTDCTFKYNIPNVREYKEYDQNLIDKNVLKLLNIFSIDPTRGNIVSTINYIN